MVRVAIITLLVAGIGGYALYESRNLLRGPVIVIDEPLDGRTSYASVTDIKGRAQNIVRIRMNDQDISVNESGAFQEKFALSNGDNTVKISAEDRFGRTAEVFIQILYAEPDGPPGQATTLVNQVGKSDENFSKSGPRR